MTVQSWTDQMSLSLDQYGIVGRLDDPEGWQDWAARAINLPGISSQNPPDPYTYEEWGKWAERFNQILGQ